MINVAYREADYLEATKLNYKFDTIGQDNMTFTRR